ncbi:hypothetical protein BaRGS_00036533 [Batillaria attramentaria]|uniref:Apple domain-containing protein n=1 Tax=Batillaria attramentaria TaxID=370345 RepID=A0ABD0JB59_9CAEN
MYLPGVLVLLAATLAYGEEQCPCTCKPSKCEASSRQQEYMMYPKSGIVSNNIRSMDGSVDECKSACTADTSCLSFEYNPSRKGCHLQDATALTAPSDWKANPTDPDWNNYQPYCA